MLKQAEEPFLQLVEAGVANVERVVVQPVHRGGVNPLFAVHVREQHDHRGGVPFAFDNLGQRPLDRLDSPQLQQRVTSFSLSVNLREGNLVPCPERSDLGAEPCQFSVGG